ncbi:MAG: dynamin family protein [Beutenbergiaceae bacterium]
METELTQMRTAVAAAQFTLPTPDVDMLRELQSGVINQLDDYLIPRYLRLDAPLLAVVGGSTGAGKSTLVNTLVQDAVTVPGALRPTTRDPVLIHHPGDAQWFQERHILPGFARVGPPVTPSAQPEPGSAPVLRLVPHASMQAGLGLLDAPDVDSVVDSNRQLAAQLLAAADLWIFVTTANRYADAVPWQLLRDAASREVVVAIVLDRVPPPVREDIAGDLYQMLVAHGLERAPLFVLEEQELTNGMLPATAVADLHAWLHTLTADALTRTQVVRQTLEGATANVVGQVEQLAQGLGQQDQTREQLQQLIADSYSTNRVEAALGDGALLRGEVLARWQDFIGTGEFFRALESRIGRARDKLAAFFRGRPQPEEQVKEAIGEGLHAVLVAEADAAAERAHALLLADPAGRSLLAGRDWSRAGEGFSERSAAAIRDWQKFILDLVQTEGQGRRTGARILAFSVNGIGVVLMIVAFSMTGGVAGAEVAIAGGTAVVAQRLLEAVFGEDGVRRLAKSAREDLLARVDRLLASEQQRFTDLIDRDQSAVGADDLAATAAAVRAAQPISEGER